MPIEAAKATRMVLAFLESRFDTDSDSAVKKDMEGFFTRRLLRPADGLLRAESAGRSGCIVSGAASLAASGEEDAGLAASGAEGSYGLLSDFTLPSRSLMILVA